MTALDPGTLVRALLDAGYGPFTGVPCSFLGPVISCLEGEHPDLYSIVNNEGEAVALAVGARLAGRRPVVIMQNSGLGNAVNPLTTLCHTLRLPVLLFVTWRGEPGRPDEPQHELMGRITPGQLSAMEIQYATLPQGEEALRDQLTAAGQYMDRTGLPFAFVVPKGAIAPYRASAPTDAAVSVGESGLMLRADAIGAIVGELAPRTLLIATTGKTARELERDWDRPENLYVVGSMGCASSIALGVALHAADREVAVLDGDGAALMRLEAMATIGRLSPANLLHFVLDNAAYESTGNQPTGSSHLDFPALASACGYEFTTEVTDEQGLRTAVAAARATQGPSLIRIHIASGSDPNLGRPALPPPLSAQRFQKALAS
ncbi:phosphonopyruvate decarboxylase [Streptomyces sp. NPDC003952]